VLLAFKQAEKADALSIENPKDRAKFDIEGWLRHNFPHKVPYLVAGQLRTHHTLLFTPPHSLVFSISSAPFDVRCSVQQAISRSSTYMRASMLV